VCQPSVPVLAAAVSRENLSTSLSLAHWGERRCVVLETSHHPAPDAADLVCGRSMPVLEALPGSRTCCSTTAARGGGDRGERVDGGQFDEHKLLVVYARDLEPFEAALMQAGMKRDDQLKLITEGEHLHSTDPRYHEQFERLCCRVGVSESAERVSW
jgi:hypothetical protein